MSKSKIRFLLILLHLLLLFPEMNCGNQSEVIVEVRPPNGRATRESPRKSWVEVALQRAMHPW